MPAEQRVLPAAVLASLDAYRDQGGCRGLDAARRLGASGVIDEVESSGLRGRGGAGFPTGRKWRTVAKNQSPIGTTVVVNGAEGEPGSFKDRAILRANPYAVLEGATIAARAVGASNVLIALKRTFTKERQRLDRALAEARDAGWAEDVAFSIVEGPAEYLFGEETALLEVIDGRPPFPRVSPPFRHGAVEVVETTEKFESTSAAGVELAGPGPDTIAPPTLANNVETLANVAGIVADGADWFRSVGTDESPGTIVCTVSGRTAHAGVAEMAMGTPLAEIIDVIGGGASDGRRLVAAMSGVANALVPAELFSTPASYEDLAAIGSGLGAAGFLVYDDETDLLAVAAGVSRFLAVESCGQCTPCKRDGLTLRDVLGRALHSDVSTEDLRAVDDALVTIPDSARCYLATQHQVVVRSILELFPEVLQAHADDAAPATGSEPIAPIADLVDGEAVLDNKELTKQPDWTYDDTDSGKWPAANADQVRDLNRAEAS